MTSTVTMRRGIFAVVIAAALPCAGSAFLAAPAATGSTDPCAASEVARTIGSVAKSTGDYLDSHPETNQVMTSALQQQAGPQSLGPLKTYFEANPKVASDMQGLANPLNKLGTQCRLPISLPQALSLMQAAQGAGGLPGLSPASLPAAGTPASPPAAGTPASPPVAGTPASPPAAGTPASPSVTKGPMPGPPLPGPKVG